MHELIVEKYANSTYHYQPTVQTYRWLVPGYPLICGGSIIDAADWEHIRKDFGAEFCINVQNERSDMGSVPSDRLCEVPTDDAHAPPIPHENLAKVLEYVLSKPADCKLYVHCQMGGSRTPAFAYLILRGKYGLSQEQALATINVAFIERERDHHGDAALPYCGGSDDARRQGHWRYINSIEAYLATRPDGGGKVVPFQALAQVVDDPSVPVGTTDATVTTGKKFAIVYSSLAMGRPLNVAELLTDARGMTGSEGTAIGYAVGLAARGHAVTVYTNVTAPQSYKGVRFRHDSEWTPSVAEEFDAVVSFMQATPLIGVSAKVFRVFNMQCGDFGGQPSGWEDHTDLLCALSHKHADVMRPTTALPSDKWRVMYNGVDTEQFTPGLKIPGRCIWASSHDRGLHHVLEAWPEVRAAVPHAELHVFYDINGLERFAKMGATDVPFLRELQRRSVYEIEMMRRLKNHGVFLGGSVSRDRMRQEMAKAEVLAYPSDAVKFCVTGDTLVDTTDGMRRIDEMESVSSPLVASTDGRYLPTSRWYYSGEREVLGVRTRHGFSVSGTANHPVLVLTPELKFEWREIGKLQVGDHVCVNKGARQFPNRLTFDEFAYDKKQVTSKPQVKILPREMTPELGAVLGYLASEGSVTKNSIMFCNMDPEVIDDFIRCFSVCFPDTRLHRFVRKSGITELQVCSRWVLCFFRKIGLMPSVAHTKKVPWSIERADERSVAAFLGAYFEGDGSVSRYTTSVVSVSNDLLRVVQILLLKFGIAAVRHDFGPERRIGYVKIAGADNLLAFSTRIGFRSTRKSQYAQATAGFRRGNIDKVPFVKAAVTTLLAQRVRGRAKHNLYRYETDSGEQVKGSKSRVFNERSYGNGTVMTLRASIRSAARRVQPISEKLAREMVELCDYPYLYDPVVSIESGGTQKTYDISVPETHAFTGNGIICHNTETFGCTVLEAMSSGCVPVLCFADAFAELWESRGCPGVAWPYEPHKREYVDKLVNVLRHPQKWASDLREKAKDFAWPGLVEKLERCLLTRGADGLDRPAFSEETPVDYVKYIPYHDRFAVAS